MKLIIDIETTGLSSENDEIIQFSAIDEYANTLMNCYIKPIHVKEWDEAMAVNGITPQMLEDKPFFGEYKELIQMLFNHAEELISYNGNFDIQFLKANGITIDSDLVHFDVMREFAPIYGEWNEKYNCYKWQKLTKCASYFGYEFNAHDALEDVKATLYCYKQMTNFKKDNYEN